MKTSEYLKEYQKVAYKTLFNGFNEKRISHAYLLSGGNGSPLKETALFLAQSLVCNESPLACEECYNCKRIANGTYPDFFMIDGSNESIKKTQVEELQEEFSKVSFEENGKKVYIIHLVEKASTSAINSLLKFLEEPSSDVVAILTTKNISKVLSTIISRCQIIRLKDYSSNEIKEMLIREDADASDAFIASKMFTKLEEAREYIAKKEYNEIKDSSIETLSAIANGEDVLYFNMSSIYKIINTKDKCFKYLLIIKLLLNDILNYRLKKDINFINNQELIKKLDLKFKDLNEVIKLVVIYQGYLDSNMNISLLLDDLFYNLVKEVN